MCRSELSEVIDVLSILFQPTKVFEIGQVWNALFVVVSEANICVGRQIKICCCQSRHNMSNAFDEPDRTRKQERPFIVTNWPWHDAGHLELNTMGQLMGQHELQLRKRLSAELFDTGGHADPNVAGYGLASSPNLRQ